MNIKAIFIIIFLLLGIYAAYLSQQAIHEEKISSEICVAASEKNFEKSLSLYNELKELDNQKDAIECLCFSALAHQKFETCHNKLSPIFKADSSWSSEPIIMFEEVNYLLKLEKKEEAKRLNHLALSNNENDVSLYVQSLRLQLTKDPKALFLEKEFEKLKRNIGDGKNPLRIQLLLKIAHFSNQIGHTDMALKVLNLDPIPVPESLKVSWILDQMTYAATIDDENRFLAYIESGKKAGLDQKLLHAQSVLMKIVYNLMKSNQEFEESCEKALDQPDSVLQKHAFFKSLFRRNIQRLAIIGKEKKANEVLDRALKLFPDFNYNRRNIFQAAGQILSKQSINTTASSIDFSSPLNGTLFVSPPYLENAAKAFEKYEIGNATKSNPQHIRLKRKRQVIPVRWVFRDEKNIVRQSGSLWPEKDPLAVVSQAIDPTESQPLKGYQAPTLKQADGNRRLVAVLLDSADWRIMQYMNARGELPFLSYLWEKYTSGVMNCLPADTSSSVAKILHPGTRQKPKTLKLVSQVKQQVSFFTKATQKTQPLWELLLPEKEHLFKTLGHKNHRALNLLRNAGGIKTGNTGFSVGPNSKNNEIFPVLLEGKLSEENRQRFKTLASPPEKVPEAWIEETIGAFNMLDQSIAMKDLDFMLVHIDPLDFASHNTLSPLENGRPETENSYLRELYQYTDMRLSQAYASLDADDILVVFSDHGVSSELSHHPDGVFIAATDEDAFKSHSFTHRPDIDGLPWWFAQQLGINVNWPSAGFEELPQAKNIVQ